MRLVFLCSKLCLPPPRRRSYLFSRKPSGLQSIDCQEILTEPRQNDNAVILPNTLKISNLSCEIFVAEKGSQNRDYSLSLPPDGQRRQSGKTIIYEKVFGSAGG